MRTVLLSLTCVSVLVACGPPPSLDDYVLSGPVTGQYLLDKEECKAEVQRKRAVDTRFDTAGGGLSGAISGAIIGDSTEAAMAGAVIGLVSSGTKSNRQQILQQRRLIAACLQQKGHPVVG